MKREPILEKVAELRETNEAGLADFELYHKGKKNEISLIASLAKRLLSMRKTINDLEFSVIEKDVWTE